MYISYYLMIWKFNTLLLSGIMQIDQVKNYQKKQRTVLKWLNNTRTQCQYSHSNLRRHPTVGRGTACWGLTSRWCPCRWSRSSRPAPPPPPSGPSSSASHIQWLLLPPWHMDIVLINTYEGQGTQPAIMNKTLFLNG